ncbi:MAG: alcohol dehydrogenase catalytic domain-containing protein [Rhodocyclaceae bacterium]|nr:alcohol dehydrogenase catalytic domain-containing protein [Rhodocyclaceae bacterium]
MRVVVCGICGTDLGYLATGGLRGSGEQPMPLGHELSGVIDSIGDEVEDLRPDMRVVVNPDDDAIGNGGPEGGFCHTVLVRNARSGRNIHVLPDSVPFELAALVEPLSVALHGVNRAKVKPDSQVVVYGAGMIGLGVIVNLRRRGVRDIVVVDRQDCRLALARRMGATATINPDHEPRLGGCTGEARLRHHQPAWSSGAAGGGGRPPPPGGGGGAGGGGGPLAAFPPPPRAPPPGGGGGGGGGGGAPPPPRQ